MPKLPDSTSAQDLFSLKEVELLLKWYDFYHGLETGHLTPHTPDQHHFISMCHGQVEPVGPHEEVYRKYMNARAAAEKIERVAAELAAAENKYAARKQMMGNVIAAQGEVDAADQVEMLPREKKKTDTTTTDSGDEHRTEGKKTDIPDVEEGYPKFGWT